MSSISGCCYTIREAAETLGVSIVTARKMLGKPDKIDRTKYNLPKHLYAIPRVEEEKQKQSKKSDTEPASEKCRICHCVTCKERLKGGRCDSCRARNCLLSFCCNGCIVGGKVDCELLSCLKEAIQKIEAKREGEAI